MEGKFGRERDESEHQENESNDVWKPGKRDKKGVCDKNGKFPCGICGKGVGNNSIVCTSCNKWIHGRCTGIKGNLERVGHGFLCKRCCKARNNLQTVQVLNGKSSDVREMDMGGSLKLEVVNSFCYLGDVLDSQGGVEAALNARIGKGWAALDNYLQYF